MAKSNRDLMTIKVPNPIIDAVMYQRHLARCIFRLGIDKIACKEFIITDDGYIVVRYSAQEIGEFAGIGGKSMYNKIKLAAWELRKTDITLVDDINEKFFFGNLCEAEYEDGILTVTYNKRLTPALLNYKYFTLIPRIYVRNLRDNKYSYRLYEILLRHSYRPKNENEIVIGPDKVRIPLPEMRLKIATEDISNYPEVQALCEKEDYQKALELLAKEKAKKSTKKDPISYPKYNDFCRKVLDGAIEEINQKTDLYVEKYRGVKNGSSEYNEIEFTVWKNGKGKIGPADKAPNESEPKGPRTNTDKEECLEKVQDQIMKEMKVTLPVAEVKTICETADYNLDVIKEKVEVAKTYSKPIKDLFRFLVSAIKNDWTHNDPAKVAKRNSFADIEDCPLSDDSLKDELRGRNGNII